MRLATTLCVAFTFASFPSFLGADLWYSSTRPKNPDPVVGRIYAHHFKGSPTVYLTASETTGLSLLPLSFLLGFGLVAIAYLNEPRDPTSSTRKMKEPILNRKHYIVLWCAIACYLVMVVFVG